MQPVSFPSPEAAAEEMLETVWWVIAGGRRIPVDPIQICLELGIDVYTGELRPEVSGMLVKKRGQSDPTVYLNREDSPNRARFTCAHELGHYVLRQGDEEEYDYIDRRDQIATTGRDPDETFANQFAAALLMPEKEVKELYDNGAAPVVTLAFKFKVSPEAMKYRLMNLGLL